MADHRLTPDRILNAAEELLRRYGPAKTTVVDVARALDVTHGSVYRHFANKATLRDAVAQRWLQRISVPLQEIVEEDGPAGGRLRRWLLTLIKTKRQRAASDPELFATYHMMVSQSPAVVAAHVGELVSQLALILADGMQNGRFVAGDPQVAAAAVFDATIRFHHPAHADEWSAPDIDAAFDRVFAMLLRGLTTSGNAVSEQFGFGDRAVLQD